MRNSPAELSPDQFRAIGHDLVDRVADFLSTIKERRVEPALAPREIRTRLGTPDSVPTTGEDAAAIAVHAAQLVVDHYTLNGPPRLFGLLTASATPIRALVDLIAA